MRVGVSFSYLARSYVYLAFLVYLQWHYNYTSSLCNSSLLLCVRVLYALSEVSVSHYSFLA